MSYQIVRKNQLATLREDAMLLRRGVEDATKQIHTLKKTTASQHIESSELLVEELNQSIQALHEHLAQIDLEEKRRNWVSEGLAKFVDIQKYSNENLEAFYSNLVSSLVKYLNANQGGLFVTNLHNNTEPTLDLVSCYAYDKKKYLDKSIRAGEGLIGQCFLEKEHILLTDVPDGYTNITSGLGDATPQCLLVFPLIADEKVVGILEIASFHVFENYHLEFLQKLSENIASTIYNSQTNEQTKRLLQISHEQMEQLRQQEEELRQNMEELSAMQDQIQQQLTETQALKKELEVREEVFGYTTIMSESDKFGTITFVNDKLCAVSKYSREELIGQPHNIFRHPDTPSIIFKIMWDTIKRGNIFQGIIKNKAKDGTHYWVDATIVPVLDENKNVVKYIGARYHIKDDALAQTLYDKQMSEIQSVLN
jgi:PAS domain S-box-containing protein